MTIVLRIILSDSAALFREALADVLARREGCEVVGQSSELGETLRLVGELQPDLLITDWALLKGGALELLEHLRGRGMPTRVLILTGVRAPEALGAALAAGACGYALKEEGLEEFFKALEAVIAGGSYVAPAMGEHQSCHFAEKEAEASRPLAKLTTRERQVLGYICEGRTSRQIAQLLGISPRTVDTHRVNLREKLGLRTVAGLTAFALANDLC